MFLSYKILNDKFYLLKILKEIKNNQLNILEPSFVTGIGLQYKELDKIPSFEDQKEFLKNLEDMGVVKSKAGNPIIMCPNCKKYIFSLRFICSYCKSLDIKSGQAIEHDICHNIDFEDKYLTSEGLLKCNKCNKLLKAIGVDYSKINIYKCDNCYGISSNNEQQYICISCGTINLKNELGISNLSKYIICQSKLFSFINDLEYLIRVVDELDRIGIRANCPAAIEGNSSTRHHFDLVVFDNSNNIFLILETLEKQKNKNNISENDESAILSFIGKCSDFSIPYKILITFFDLPNSLDNLLKINKINVVKMTNKDEASIEIVSRISDSLNITLEQKNDINGK